jgi:hypothetical protein
MRLRFSIRDLLWLTLVVALAVGWWLDHKRLTTLTQPLLIVDTEIVTLVPDDVPSRAAQE